MSTIDVPQLLRPGLLDGVSIMLATADSAGERDASLGVAVRVACAQLGASVCECQLCPDRSADVEALAIEQAIEEHVDAAGLDVLVVDGASVFAHTASAGRGSADAREALRACLEASWNVTRAVGNRAFLPDGRGGRIVYLAPTAEAVSYADAACAGLENLARTLSIEWARHGITTVAIAPGTVSEAAALTAYLASAAGAYFSGCLLDLRGPVEGSARGSVRR
jgi:NAD(P)-dependent dehydrogenase (short-subunit alcohol dehydrogenase family)